MVDGYIDLFAQRNIERINSGGFIDLSVKRKDNVDSRWCAGIFQGKAGLKRILAGGEYLLEYIGRRGIFIGSSGPCMPQCG